MRTLFLICALLSTSALAREPVYFIQNRAGGEIQLLDPPCKVSGVTYKDLGQVLSTTDTGAVIRGCWTYRQDNRSINVVYEGGDERLYPLEAVQQR